MSRKREKGFCFSNYILRLYILITNRRHKIISKLKTKKMIANILAKILSIFIIIEIIQNSESKQIKHQLNLEELNLQLLDGILKLILYK